MKGVKTLNLDRFLAATHEDFDLLDLMRLKPDPYNDVMHPNWDNLAQRITGSLNRRLDVRMYGEHIVWRPMRSQSHNEYMKIKLFQYAGSGFETTSNWIQIRIVVNTEVAAVDIDNWPLVGFEINRSWRLSNLINGTIAELGSVAEQCEQELIHYEGG